MSSSSSSMQKIIPPPLNPALVFGGSARSSTASASASKVLVHPVVLFHILDHHNRRNNSNDENRVIGTLLGTYSDNGIYEINNAFAVPHAERGDEVAIGKDYNRKMHHLYQRAYSTTTTTTSTTSTNKGGNQNDNTTTTTSSNTSTFVVGWYASGGLLQTTSSLIHEFYANELCDLEYVPTGPIHLVVDTTQLNTTTASADHSLLLPFRAYQNIPLLLQNEHVGNVFNEIDIELYQTEAEKICLNEMIKQQTVANGGGGGGAGTIEASGTTTANNTEALQVSMKKLYDLLDTALEYVNGVVEKGHDDGTADKQQIMVGRQISDCLSEISHLQPEIFDNLFHEQLQDLLMVTYLSNLTRTNLDISEKLNSTL